MPSPNVLFITAAPISCCTAQTADADVRRAAKPQLDGIERHPQRPKRAVRHRSSELLRGCERVRDEIPAQCDTPPRHHHDRSLPSFNATRHDAAIAIDRSIDRSHDEPREDLGAVRDHRRKDERDEERGDARPVADLVEHADDGAREGEHEHRPEEQLVDSTGKGGD